MLQSVEEEIMSANGAQSDVALSWSASLLVPVLNDTLVAASQQPQSSTPTTPIRSADSAIRPSINMTEIIDRLLQSSVLPLVSAAAASKVRLIGAEGALRLQEQHHTNASSLIGWMIGLGRTTEHPGGKFEIKSIV